jgi:hypothetical protein
MTEQVVENCINALHHRFEYVKIELLSKRVQVYVQTPWQDGNRRWACTSSSVGTYAERLQACAERLICNFDEYAKNSRTGRPIA